MAILEGASRPASSDGLGLVLVGLGFQGRRLAFPVAIGNGVQASPWRRRLPLLGFSDFCRWRLPFTVFFFVLLRAEVAFRCIQVFGLGRGRVRLFSAVGCLKFVIVVGVHLLVGVVVFVAASVLWNLLALPLRLSRLPAFRHFLMMTMMMMLIIVMIVVAFTGHFDFFLMMLIMIIVVDNFLILSGNLSAADKLFAIFLLSASLPADAADVL